jgi:hypothetical protein
MRRWRWSGGRINGICLLFVRLRVAWCFQGGVEVKDCCVSRAEAVCCQLCVECWVPEREERSRRHNSKTRQLKTRSSVGLVPGERLLNMQDNGMAAAAVLANETSRLNSYRKVWLLACLLALPLYWEATITREAQLAGWRAMSMCELLLYPGQLDKVPPMLSLTVAPS